MDFGKVSIIIPVYNAEKYLDECIVSVHNQIYKNLQVIIIDDGSTDKSVQICDEWARRDDRIEVYHRENLGVSNARNFGINKIKGEFVAFLDSDDWLDDDWIFQLVEAIVHDGTDIIVGGHVREFEGNSNILLRKGRRKVLTAMEALEEMYSDNGRQKYFWWELCDKLFRKDVINGKLLNENIYVCEDQLMTWQIFIDSGSVTYLPIFGYHYRMHSESTIHTVDFARELTSLDAIELIKQDMDKRTVSKKLRHEVDLQLIHCRIGHIKLIMIHADTKYKARLTRELGLVRKNFWNYLTVSDLTIKGRLAIVLYIFPVFIIKFFLFIINSLENNNDKRA